MGSPRTLSPHESRLSGKWIIAGLVVLLVLVSLLVAYLIASGKEQLERARGTLGAPAESTPAPAARE